MKTLLLTATLCGSIAIAGCGGEASSGSPVRSDRTVSVESSADAGKRSEPKLNAPNGAPPKDLVEKDLIEGAGPIAEAGKEVTVQYIGFNYGSGKEVTSSWDAQPFSFKLGSGVVIPGVEQGIEGMKAGGRRELIIPPKLAASPGGEPAPYTVVYVIDLLKVS